VVLTDAEEVKAGFVHEFNFFYELLQPLLCGLGFPFAVDIEIAKHSNA
jgi:hypothetical protein